MNPVLARSLFRCAPLEKRPSAGQRMTPPPALPPDHNVCVCVCVCARAHLGVDSEAGKSSL